jgi:hypothetical protein
MEQPQKIEQLLETLSTQPEGVREKLISEINALIIHDFPLLVQLLYRVDVNEKKLKEVLKKNKDQDAAMLIADLLIKRQLEKIETRRKMKNENAEDKDW